MSVVRGRFEVMGRRDMPLTTVRLITSTSIVKWYGNDEYLTGPPMDIGEVFRCVSAMCTSDPLSTPQKSNPLFRMKPPPMPTAKSFYYWDKPGVRKFSFHLPSDYRALYPVAPLAYYLGAAVEEIEENEEPHITFKAGEAMSLPSFPDMEDWAGDVLRRMFYLDCAVRYTSQSGKKLDGLDVRDLTGFCADDIFDMDAEERFRLYLSSGMHMPGLPPWHMAAYLDPVPESLEALPFLLHALSAIYMPECVSTTERGLVSMSVRNFLGRQKIPGPTGGDMKREIVIPALREAGRASLVFRRVPGGCGKVQRQGFCKSRAICRNKKTRSYRDHMQRKRHGERGRRGH